MKRLDMSGVSWDEIQVEEPNDPTSSDSGIKYKMTTDSLDDVSGVKYKFYVTNIDSNEPQKEILVTGDEDNSFLFENKWDRVFCYGKEIDDFHALEKERLFALNFSATQEIDKIQQQDSARITELESKNTELESKNTELESKNTDLQNENKLLKDRVEMLEMQMANILQRLSDSGI